MEAAWDGPTSGSRGGSLVLPYAQGGGIWPDGAGMPDPSRKRPTNQAGTRADPWPAI
jgi:hypothetical protein